MYVKKIVSCFLAIVFVMHCATFSSYSVPTSSVPTLAVPTPAVPTSSVPNEETFPELSGGDGEVQYCIEVPEVITFYTNTYDMKARLVGNRYRFNDRYTISCNELSDGYCVEVCVSYQPNFGNVFVSNSFSVDFNGASLVFYAKGTEAVDCYFNVSNGLFNLNEDEEKEFGKVSYYIVCDKL